MTVFWCEVVWNFKGWILITWFQSSYRNNKHLRSKSSKVIKYRFQSYASIPKFILLRCSWLRKLFLVYIIYCLEYIYLHIWYYYTEFLSLYLIEYVIIYSYSINLLPTTLNFFSFYLPYQQHINLLFLRCNASNRLALKASSAVSNRPLNNHVCVQDNTN